ncbi:MAG TPA: zf-HC2 domain-containing protein, partial [Myxococcota bacterium]|nr:zf-HC2 domain-containing protein [Myxococcota bacterium]
MLMTCEQAIERLPWLLNGTLEGEELQEVQHHLETCESCRKALAETRDAWRLFNQHLPSQALVALAYGEVPEGLDAALAERHVASCPQCAAELELARMSRRLEEANNLALFTPKPAPVRDTAREYRTWRGAALAASLVGLIAIGGWFQSAQRVHLVPGIQATQAALETEMKAQQEQIKRISQPQINVWNQQVHWDEVERGG